MATSNLYTPMSSRPALPTYVATPQKSAIGKGPVNYISLAEAADVERQASMKRDAERQNIVIGGYDQQMANSRNDGDQAYLNLRNDYSQVTADALATRDRNMARVDQYGNSMRSDLYIQGKQRLAKASQTAIQRGLGNTTIQDSLVRGQNFDNTRQQLSLEDQLLNNRILTDSNLSSVYQGILQNRANGLNAQANQNISNDNTLAGNRLSYIGGIKDNMDNFNTVSNLYSQNLQQQNANEQAMYDRQLQNRNIPAKFRLVNRSIQKSADNGHSWQADTDQRQKPTYQSRWM